MVWLGVGSYLIVRRLPPAVIGELFTFAAFSARTIQLPRLAKFASGSSIPRAVAFVVHGLKVTPPEA